jgi:hypothetical protein
VFAFAGALALVTLQPPRLHSPAPIDVGSVPDVDTEVTYREVPARALTSLGDPEGEVEADAGATEADGASGTASADGTGDPGTGAASAAGPGGSGGTTAPTDPVEGTVVPLLPPPPTTLPAELTIPRVTTVPLPPLTLPPPDEEPVVTLPPLTLPPATVPPTTVPPDITLIDDLPWFDLDRASD